MNWPPQKTAFERRALSLLSLLAVLHFFSARPVFAAVEASVNRAGLAQQVSFFNWQSQTWNFAAGTIAPVVDTALELRTLLVASYVAGDGSVRAKVGWNPINDEDPAQDGWLHHLDVAKWTLVR